jgi:O-antigen ligase
MLVELLAIVRALLWRQPIWAPFWDYAKPGFLAAFLLIFLAFALSAKTPSDLRYAGNFVMLALFVPISGIFGRLADPRNFGRIALFILAGTIGSFALAVVETVFLHQQRAYGFYSDPIWGAQATLIFGALGAAGYRAKLTPIPRALYLLSPVIATATTALTGSRGPLLAAPLLALIIVIFVGRRARIGALLALVAVVAIGAAISIGSPALWPRFSMGMTDLRNFLTDHAVTDASAGIRLLFWHIGWQAFSASPLFGYGWAHFLEAAYYYLPNHGLDFAKRYPSLRGNIHLHSDIVDFAVSGGLLGLAAYVLILLAPVVAIVKSPRDSQYSARLMGIILLAVGYLCCGLSYLMFGFEFHTTLYVAAAAFLVSYCRDAPPAPLAPAAAASLERPSWFRRNRPTL